MQEQRGNRPFPDQTIRQKDLQQSGESAKQINSNNHERFFTAKQRKLNDQFE